MTARTTGQDTQPARLPVARHIGIDPPEPTWRILAGGPAIVLLCALMVLVAATIADPTLELVLIALALVAVATVYGWAAVRSTRRLELANLLSGRLLSLTGACQLRATRWAGLRVGHPRRIRVVYGGGAAGTDPGFEAAVTELAEAVLGTPYQVHRHRTKQATLTLRAYTRPPEPVQVDDRTASVKRAEQLLETMLPGRTITDLQVDDAGEVIAVDLSHDLGAKVASGRFQDRVESTFNRCMEGRWRSRWDTVNDQVRFEIRPSLPDAINLPAPSRTDLDPVQSYGSAFFRVGVDEDGHEVGWRPKRDPMCLVVGATGTGKTVVIRSLVEQMAFHGWQVWIVDGKGTEFLGLRSWPNVAIVANRIPEQIAVIYRAHAIMEERYALVEQGLARTDDFEPLGLLVDEWTDFRSNLLAWYAAHKPKGAPAKPPVLELVASTVRKGRTARVHVICGTQRPDQTYFGDDMRDNFNMRVSTGRLKLDGARMTWGSPTIGTTVPRGKLGRSTAVNEDGQPVEIQAYYNPDPFDLRPGDPQLQQLEQHKPVTTRHPRMVIIPPEPLVDLDGDADPIDPDYWDCLQADWGWAADHPDLDPVQIAAHADPADSRGASSTARIMGLIPPPVTDLATNGTEGESEHSELASPAAEPADPPVGPTQAPTHPAPDPPRHLHLVTDDTAADRLEDLEVAVDTYGDDGYDDPAWAAVTDLSIGWLIRDNDADEHWAVIEDIGDDPQDSTQCAISWRDDEDNDGQLSLPHDETILARQPQDDE